MIGVIINDLVFQNTLKINKIDQKKIPVAFIFLGITFFNTNTCPS